MTHRRQNYLLPDRLVLLVERIQCLAQSSIMSLLGLYTQGGLQRRPRQPVLYFVQGLGRLEAIQHQQFDDLAMRNHVLASAQFIDGFPDIHRA